MPLLYITIIILFLSVHSEPHVKLKTARKKNQYFQQLFIDNDEVKGYSHV